MQQERDRDSDKENEPDDRDYDTGSLPKYNIPGAGMPSGSGNVGSFENGILGAPDPWENPWDKNDERNRKKDSDR